MIRREFRSQNRRRKGNTILEFALVMLFLFPLFIGTVNLGMNLTKTTQASQITRDAGHMYVRQVDFSLDASKNIVVRLAQGLGMTLSGGKGVILLSKIMYIGTSECAAANLAPASCPNYHKAVVIQRHTIGNTTMRTSDFATPASSIILTGPDAVTGLKKGDIKPADYLTNATVQSPKLLTLLPGMLEGETAYVSEGYFDTPSFTLNQSYTATSKGTYTRSIY
ncbi:MAG: TadE family protein [Bryobacteraceae bacterium]